MGVAQLDDSDRLVSALFEGPRGSFPAATAVSVCSDQVSAVSADTVRGHSPEAANKHFL
jgi:hypothetical protein